MTNKQSERDRVMVIEQYRKLAREKFPAELADALAELMFDCRSDGVREGYKAGAENATKPAYDIGHDAGRKAGIEAAAKYLEKRQIRIGESASQDRMVAQEVRSLAEGEGQ